MNPGHDDLVSRPERRRTLRQPTNPKAVMITHAECGSHAGILLDVSRTGVRFRTRYDFPGGSEVLILPPAHTDLPAIQARTIHQSEVDDDGVRLFEYGAEFIEPTEEAHHAWFLVLRRAA